MSSAPPMKHPHLARVERKPSWEYRPPKLTQYWRVPAHEIYNRILRPNAKVRRKYWASDIEVPGGTAFENFEVRQRYVPAGFHLRSDSEDASGILAGDPAFSYTQERIEEQPT